MQVSPIKHALLRYQELVLNKSWLDIRNTTPPPLPPFPDEEDRNIMENTGDTYGGHGAAARGAAPGHYIRASARQGRGVTMARDLCLALEGWEHPGSVPPSPASLQGHPTAKTSIWVPHRAKSCGTQPEGSRRPPHCCPKAIPKPCQRGWLTTPQHRSIPKLALFPLTACVDVGKWGRGARRDRIASQKKPQASLALSPPCRGARCHFTHRDRDSPASRPDSQPGTGSLHHTKKTLMLGDLFFVVEVLMCLWRRCPALAECGEPGGPHGSHPCGSVGCHKPHEGFINPRDLWKR